MAEEERGFERFDLENEFEGGDWVGGEFVYERERKRRRMTKEERLYGAFLDDDENGQDEEEDDTGEDYDSSDDERGSKYPGRGGRGRGSAPGRGRVRPDYSAPVSFVAKGVYKGDTQGRSKDDDDEEDAPRGLGLGAGSSRRDRREEEDEEGADEGRGFGGLGLGGNRGALGQGSSKGKGGFVAAPHSYQEEEDTATEVIDTGGGVLPSAFGRQIRQRAQAKLQQQAAQQEARAREKEAREGMQELATFERFTKGIGSKLLLKMGFRPGEGLGKDRKGMAKPLEVKMRPKNMGMGFNDFKEAGALNRREPSPDKAKEEAKGRGKNGRPLEADETEAAIERAREQQRRSWKKGGRGPKVKREYRTAEDLLKDQEGGPAPLTIIDMRGPEARLVGRGEDGLLATEAGPSRVRTVPMPELQHNLALLVDLTEAEIRRLDVKGRTDQDTAEALGAEEGRLQGAAAEYRGAFQRMQRLGDLVASVSPRADGTLPALGEMEASLREAYSVFKDEYREYNLASVAACRLHAHLRVVFSHWDPFADPSRGLDTLKGWKALLAPNGLEEAGSPLGALLEDLLVPPLRPLITTQWDCRDAEPLVQLFEAWEPLLPRDLLQRLLEHLVLPRLRGAVEAWEPRSDPVPLHSWLHPWLPLLLDRLEPLYAPVRHKLAVALQQWHPADSSALAILVPWKPVWGKKDWDAFCARSIAPKLQAVLQHEFVVNPAQQEMAPFEWVMAWAGVISDALLAQVLEQGLFPQWHAVLQHWLASGGDRDEITRWYLGWRALVPQDLLAHDRIRSQLAAGLNAINAVPGTHGWARELQQQQQPYFAAAPQPQPSAPAPSAPPPPAYEPPTIPLPSDHEVSLIELVQSFASSNNLPFIPRGRNQFGQQIYRIGNVSIVLDSAKQLIKAQLGATADSPWSIISLEDLMREHQRRESSKAMQGRAK